MQAATTSGIGELPLGWRTAEGVEGINLVRGEAISKETHCRSHYSTRRPTGTHEVKGAYDSGPSKYNRACHYTPETHLIVTAVGFTIWFGLGVVTVIHI